MNKAQERNIRITVISIIAVIVVFFGLFLNKLLTPRLLSTDELRYNGVVLFEKPRIVGDFDLIDKNGAPVDKTIFEDKVNLVFFGFTHCPDICPTTLSELTRVYANLSGKAQDAVQLGLVTLDPARDTPEKIKPYVNYYDEQMLGLTGEFPQVMSLANNMNIAFQKIPQGERYTIDHSSQVVILNRHGDYAGFIKTPLPVAALPRIIESTLMKVID